MNGIETQEMDILGPYASSVASSLLSVTHKWPCTDHPDMTCCLDYGRLRDTHRPDHFSSQGLCELSSSTSLAPLWPMAGGGAGIMCRKALISLTITPAMSYASSVPARHWLTTSHWRNGGGPDCGPIDVTVKQTSCVVSLKRPYVI